MASTTFTERYVDAAMRTVPEAQRADLSAELRAAIADQTEARAEAGENRESAERAVLESLGDPEKLAASYTDRPLHLIGPRYYLLWWRLVKLLWCIVTPLAAFGIALGQTLAGAPSGRSSAPPGPARSAPWCTWRSGPRWCSRWWSAARRPARRT